MRVHNLTDNEKIYRGKPIAPHSSLEFPTLSFIPDRDRELETRHILAFGELPAWYVRQQQAKREAEKIQVQTKAEKQNEKKPTRDGESEFKNHPTTTDEVKSVSTPGEPPKDLPEAVRPQEKDDVRATDSVAATEETTFISKPSKLKSK